MSAPGYGVHPAHFASSAGCSPTGPAPTGKPGSLPDCHASSICHREPVVAFDGSLLVMKGSRHDALCKDGCEGGSEVVGRERMHQCADPCASQHGPEAGAEQRFAGSAEVARVIADDARSRQQAPAARIGARVVRGGASGFAAVRFRVGLQPGPAWCSGQRRLLAHRAPIGDWRSSGPSPPFHSSRSVDWVGASGPSTS